MTQEEDKDLLLKYLCMALPYDVVVRCYFVDGGGEEVLDTDDIADLLYNEENSEFPMYKPYLRPMSSMTEEESNELESITFPLMEKDWDGNENPACIRWIDIPKYMDFILSHHFDFMGLIPKGLAIEINESNNPYDNE